MRAFALASLVLVAACGPSSSNPNNTSGNPDGGATGNQSDGGTTTHSDGGTTPACTDGATEACPGVTGGSCDPGTRTCTGGHWAPCDGRTQPQPGLCDFDSCAGGSNPGCACHVGDFQECNAQATATLGHGTCTAGFQECVAIAGGSKWGDCLGEVVPQADDCSGRELNCNSGAAPDCGCTNGQTRPCGGVTGGTCALGTQTCASSKWGACTGFVQPAKADCGDPSCLSTAGKMLPNPGCQCVIGETEPCYTGPADTANQGTCAPGTRTCDGSGMWGDCVGQTHPIPSCDFPSCSGTPLPACE